ncbi:MAG: hypothetical protein MUF53_02160 [Gemmatimonadaceae bacterium]|nr:hypothetical protein [Gemmatimonadaceae bacterium]
MTEDIVAIVMTFGTIMVLGLGIPLIIGWNRRRMASLQASAAQPDPMLAARLAHIETAVDTMAIELERIAEGQRFVTRLLSETRAVGPGAAAPVAVPARESVAAGPRDGASNGG